MSKKKIGWYSDINDLYLDYRKMSTNQLELKYYGVSTSTIKNILKMNKFEVRKKYINSTLNSQEVIFMYNSLLKGEIISFSNGMFTEDNKNRYAYCDIILKYIFNDILKWCRKDYCEMYSNKILKEYKLTAMLSTLNINTYDILQRVCPKFNIKIWELKSSTCGNDFWNDENISKALQWLKLRVSDELNLKNINECGKYGFRLLLKKYNLSGLCVVRFDGSSVNLFENMYGCTYDANEMLEINYTFEIDTSYNKRDKNGILYYINEDYHNLDNIRKTLANEIIKYCEQENRFPNEKDLTNKKGYISRSQFDRFFGGFKNATKYVQEINSSKGCKGNRNSIKSKFETYACKKCNVEKPFNQEYYNQKNTAKFGLSYICKECMNKDKISNNYKKRNIAIGMEDEDVILWWNKMFNKEIKVMPKYCYSEQNMIKIIKHIVEEIENKHDKDSIIEWFVKPNTDKYYLSDMIYKLGNKLTCLNKCFPNYKFKRSDFEIYNDDKMIEIIDKFINDNNIKTEDILNGKAKLTNNKAMIAMISHYRKKGMYTNDVLVKYYKIKEIMHPKYMREICELDFSQHRNGYFEDHKNIIRLIKYYCEECCDENILNIIHNTEKLREWVAKYFTQQVISKIFSYTKYYCSLYDMLTDVYPFIKNNNILFKWEWTQCNNSDVNFLVNMLREYVLFRMNDVIDSPKDAPNYLNPSYFEIAFSKMNKHIDKKRFKNYYEWACLAFPEYKDIWTKEDFNMIVSKDGTVFDSYQERDVYELIKSQSAFKYIKSIGKNRSGKYIFKPDNSKYSSFCPDFVIEYIQIGCKKIKLQKPIIIEYYGMYEDNPKHAIFKKYKEKTIEKEKFYKNNKDIYYIPIYMVDIKNNYEGLAKKLDLFILENINIKTLLST